MVFSQVYLGYERKKVMHACFVKLSLRTSHFVLRCPYFRNDWIRFWLLMKNFLLQLNDPESELLLFFLKNINQTCRLRFLTNGLILPFSSSLRMKVQKFVAASFQKIYRIRMVRLEETQSKF